MRFFNSLSSKPCLTLNGLPAFVLFKSVFSYKLLIDKHLQGFRDIIDEIAFNRKKIGTRSGDPTLVVFLKKKIAECCKIY